MQSHPIVSVSALVALLLAVGLGPLGACGGGGKVLEPRPTPPPAEPEPPPDPFDEFSGERVPLGQRFRLGNNPKGVEGVRVVFHLVKTDWTVFELPNGGEDKTGHAVILLTKGEESKQVRITSGDVGFGLGARIEVGEVGDEHVDGRFFAFADLTVTAQ